MLLSSVPPFPELEELTETLETKTSIPFSKFQQKEFFQNIQDLVDLLKARVKKDRDAIDEYILLGRLFRLQGDPRRALRLHQNLLARPTLDRLFEKTLYTELGHDVQVARMRDFGEQYFLKALELKKNDIVSLEGLVRAYEFQSDYEKAIETLQKLIRLGRPERNRLAFVQAYLALAYVKKGQLPRAKRAAERSVTSDPNNILAQLTLADVLCAGEKYEKEIEALREVLIRWPSHSFLVLRRLEDAHYRMGAFPEYENTLRDCVRNSPDNFYLHYSLARHLRKKRKSKEALEFLRRSFELNPLYANAVRDGIEMMEEKAQLKQAALVANDFFAAFKRSRRFICPNCRHRYLSITWRCAECGAWAVFEIRYELPAP